MHCIKKLTQDLYWIGGNDRRLALFENAFPIPNGVSYNAYIIKGDENVLLDTVDEAISQRFLENLEYVLEGAPLHYIIVNHMEPDHCGTLETVLKLYPKAKVVGNQKTLGLIKQFFNCAIEERFMTIKEGDSLEVGRHKLTFVMAPMVHWPEAMVTFDETDGVLYSADAFGSFGALNGVMYADELEFETKWIDEARRYYTNIVGKYGPQVLSLLKKAANLDIRLVCPLHGPIWRENIGWYIDKYIKWASYEPEEEGVVIAYASIYGHTENAAELLASELDNLGIKKLKLYDVSSTDVSYIVADAFKYSHFVFASITYNTGLFTAMETLLHELKAHNIQKRTVALIENGSWGPVSAKKMKEIIDGMKEITLLEGEVSIHSAVKEKEREELIALANQIKSSMNKQCV